MAQIIKEEKKIISLNDEPNNKKITAQVITEYTLDTGKVLTEVHPIVCINDDQYDVFFNNLNYPICQKNDDGTYTEIGAYTQVRDELIKVILNNSLQASEKLQEDKSIRQLYDNGINFLKQEGEKI